MAGRPTPAARPLLTPEAAVGLSLVDSFATILQKTTGLVRVVSKLRYVTGAAWRLFTLPPAIGPDAAELPPRCCPSNKDEILIDPTSAVTAHGPLLVVRRMVHYLLDVITAPGNFHALTDAFQREARLLLELTEDDADRLAAAGAPGECDAIVLDPICIGFDTSLAPLLLLLLLLLLLTRAALLRSPSFPRSLRLRSLHHPAHTLGRCPPHMAGGL
jgi:hypothetical protein